MLVKRAHHISFAVSDVERSREFYGAVLGLPDAKAVCDLCDGMVMVVRADKTYQQDVQAALEVLDRRRVLGLILNGAPADRGRYGYAS